MYIHTAVSLVSSTSPGFTTWLPGLVVAHSILQQSVLSREALLASYEVQRKLISLASEFFFCLVLIGCPSLPPVSLVPLSAARDDTPAVRTVSLSLCQLSSTCRLQTDTGHHDTDALHGLTRQYAAAFKLLHEVLDTASDGGAAAAS